MNRTTALTWSWLNVLTAKRYSALMQVYSNLDTALSEISENMLRELGCREETMMIVMNRLDEFDPAAYEAELAKRDLKLISIEDEEYPAQLKTIADPPTFLYYSGDLSVLDQPCIALVGKREMSSYGQRVTESFVPDFVRAGMVTVSGLAYGIDAVVAKETIAAGGKTVAALGHGLGMIHPKSNVVLAKEIVANGGLILSEYPLDARPDKHTFPGRNRIIAGLSLGTVVLEAGEGSGALITVDLALDYGRDVFAVPGQVFDPNYIGCHQVIAKGTAKLVMSAADVLNEIGVVAGQSQEKESTYKPSNAVEEAIIKVLTTMPQSSGDIVQKAGLETGVINSALTMMELAGAAKNVGGGQWVKN